MPGSILAVLQPVKVDATVLDKIEDASKINRFYRRTIESTLTPELDAKIKELLKHEDIFFKR